MKRVLSVFSLLVAFMALMNGVTGCMDEKEYQQYLSDMGQVIDQNTELSVANAKSLLEQKYGISFETKKIGNRLNRDTTDLFMAPETNPDTVFKAVVNNEAPECSDSFVRRCVGAELSKVFCDALSKDGINSYGSLHLLINADDSNETNYEIPAEEYFDKYQTRGMMLYLIVRSPKEKNTVSLIKKECDDFSKSYHVTVALNAYFLEDGYSECREKLMETPDITSTWFSKYNPTDELVYSASYDAE